MTKSNKWICYPRFRCEPWTNTKIG